MIPVQYHDSEVSNLTGHSGVGPPFIYQDGVIHLGNDGSYHHELAQAAGLADTFDRYKQGSSYHGYINRDARFPILSWYDWIPPDQKEVVDSLSHHLGTPLKDDTLDWGEHVGASEPQPTDEDYRKLRDEVREGEGCPYGQCHFVAEVIGNDSGRSPEFGSHAHESGFFAHPDKRLEQYGYKGWIGDHSWNRMADGTILDATADQFGPKGPMGDHGEIARIPPNSSWQQRYLSYGQHHPAENPDHCLFSEWYAPYETCQAPGCTHKGQEVPAELQKSAPWRGEQFTNTDYSNWEGEPWSPHSGSILNRRCSLCGRDHWSEPNPLLIKHGASEAQIKTIEGSLPDTGHDPYRRPLIWHYPTQTLYMAQPGTSHEQLHDEFAGRIGDNYQLDSPDFGYGAFYTKIPEEPESKESVYGYSNFPDDMVAKHLGVGKRFDDDDWHEHHSSDMRGQELFPWDQNAHMQIGGQQVPVPGEFKRSWQGTVPEEGNRYRPWHEEPSGASAQDWHGQLQHLYQNDVIDQNQFEQGLQDHVNAQPKWNEQLPGGPNWQPGQFPKQTLGASEPSDDLEGWEDFNDAAATHKWVWDSRQGRGGILPIPEGANQSNMVYHEDVREAFGLNGAGGVLRDDGGVEDWGINSEDEDPERVKNVTQWLKEHHPNAHYVPGYEAGWKVASSEDELEGWEDFDTAKATHKFVWNGREVGILPIPEDRPVYHNQVMNRTGISGTCGVLRNDGGFEIYNHSPDTEEQEAIAHRLKEYHPEAHYIKGYDAGWKVANQLPLWGEEEHLRDENLPEVVHLEGHGEPNHEGGPPVIYSPHENKVWVGQQGWFHYNVHDHPDTGKRGYRHREDGDHYGRLDPEGKNLLWYRDWADPEGAAGKALGVQNVYHGLSEFDKIMGGESDSDLWQSDSEHFGASEPQVVQVTHPNHDEIQAEMEGAGFEDRIPFRYRPQHNTVFLGRPSYYHSTVADSPEWVPQRGIEDDRWDGFIWTHKDPWEVGWYDHHPEGQKVQDALSRHFGRPLENEDQDNLWAESKVAAIYPDVTVQQEGQREEKDFGNYGWRRPVIYEPDHNHVVLGLPGEYHYGLRNLLKGGLDEDDRGAEEGWVAVPNEEYEGRWGEGGYGLRMRDHNEELDNATIHGIQQALIPHEPHAKNFLADPSEEGWEMTGKTAEQMPLWEEEPQPKSDVSVVHVSPPDYMSDETHPSGPPVIYHPENKTVYVGNQGQYHVDMNGNGEYPSSFSGVRGRLTRDGQNIQWYHGQGLGAVMPPGHEEGVNKALGSRPNST
jgi:hypothetical protein